MFHLGLVSLFTTSLTDFLKAEDKISHGGPPEAQIKSIKNVTNERCNQLDRHLFVNDVEKSKDFREEKNRPIGNKSFSFWKIRPDRTVIAQCDPKHFS